MSTNLLTRFIVVGRSSTQVCFKEMFSAKHRKSDSGKATQKTHN
jgi:hypothetical protein